MRRACLFLVTFLFFGCASKHNLQTDGANSLGGGYFETRFSENVWKLTATTNFAPWPNHGAAREMWSDRASLLCGKSGYSEYQVSEFVRQHIGPLYNPILGEVKYLLTVKDGYAICGSKSFSQEELAKTVESATGVALKAVEVITALDGYCSSESEKAAKTHEELLIAGNAFFSKRDFAQAKSCFERAASGDTGNKAAMERLGFMHELGLGVEKSMALASYWYRKAGLMQ